MSRSRARGSAADGDDLGRRASGGLVSLLVGQGGQVAIQLATFPVLARLVAPEGFGVFAAALVITNLAVLLSTVGLTTALVQVPTLRDEHVRVAFTMRVLAAILVFGAMAWAGAGFAAVLGMPELTEVLPVLAAASLLRSATLGDALLRRELRFRPLAVVEVIAYVVGYGGGAVVLAAAGWGLWALIGGQVLAAVVSTVLLWVLRPHPIRPSLAAAPRRELLAVGVGFTISQGGFLAAQEADDLIVGGFLGAHALGLYERAHRLMRIPASVIGTPLGQVLYPAMASVQDVPTRVRDMFGVTTAALAVLTLPITAVAALVTRELVLVLLGPAWLELETVLVIVLAGMYAKANEAVTDSVLVASGRVGELATQRWLYTGAVVVGALVGQLAGITGVAVAALVALLGNHVALTGRCLRATGTRWRDLMRWHVPGLLLAAVGATVAAPTVGMARRAALPAPVVLMIAAAVATVAGVLTLRLAGRRAGPVQDLVREVRRLVPEGRIDQLLDGVLGREPDQSVVRGGLEEART